MIILHKRQQKKRIENKIREIREHIMCRIVCSTICCAESKKKTFQRMLKLNLIYLESEREKNGYMIFNFNLATIFRSFPFRRIFWLKIKSFYHPRFFSKMSKILVRASIDKSSQYAFHIDRIVN